MRRIHRIPSNSIMWDYFFIDDAHEYELERQSVTQGSDEITFLPNYEEDEDEHVHIENYGELKDYYIVRNIERWMDEAAAVALKSPCQKSQRGAVVVKDDRLLGKAYNGPPSGQTCNPCLRANIRDNTRFELCHGVHAEERAVRNALAATGAEGVKGARLYYVKTKDGEIRPSGGIACKQCSGIILDSGIAEVVMWQADAHQGMKSAEIIQTAHFVVYSARKFDELALEYVRTMASKGSR